MVESDALSVIQSLNHVHSVVNWKMLYTYQRIMECSIDMEISYGHIHREGNYVADFLAKEALSKNLNREVNLGVCTYIVKQMIFSDNTGIPYLRIPK